MPTSPASFCSGASGWATRPTIYHKIKSASTIDIVHSVACLTMPELSEKREKVSRVRRTRPRNRKNVAYLSINLATSFMNCVHDFFPASDMLRIPDSGCILPLSSNSTHEFSRNNQCDSFGKLTLVC